MFQEEEFYSGQCKKLLCFVCGNIRDLKQEHYWTQDLPGGRGAVGGRQINILPWALKHLNTALQPPHWDMIPAPVRREVEMIPFNIFAILSGEGSISVKQLNCLQYRNFCDCVSRCLVLYCSGVIRKQQSLTHYIINYSSQEIIIYKILSFLFIILMKLYVSSDFPRLQFELEQPKSAYFFHFWIVLIHSFMFLAQMLFLKQRQRENKTFPFFLGLLRTVLLPYWEKKILTRLTISHVVFHFLWRKPSCFLPYSLVGDSCVKNCHRKKFIGHAMPLWIEKILILSFNRKYELQKSM